MKCTKVIDKQHVPIKHVPLPQNSGLLTHLGVYEENLKANVNNLRNLELFSLLNAKNKALDNGKHKKYKGKNMKTLPPLKNSKKKKKKAPLNPFFHMVVKKANNQRKLFSLKH